MGGYYGWTKTRKKSEIRSYLAYIKKTIWFSSKVPGQDKK